MPLFAPNASSMASLGSAASTISSQEDCLAIAQEMIRSSGASKPDLRIETNGLRVKRGADN